MNAANGTPAPTLTAIVYDNGADAGQLATAICAAWASRGLRACGLIEHQRARPGRTRCDMFLRELASGSEIAISEDRGEHVRACVLDADGLLKAAQLMQQGLRAGAERAIFNKFGKAEADRGGLADVIAEAVERGVPAVVFVPRRNVPAWRAFAGEFSREIEVSAAAARTDW